MFFENIKVNMIFFVQLLLNKNSKDAYSFIRVIIWQIQFNLVYVKSPYDEFKNLA